MFPSRLMLSVINSVCYGQCSLPLGRFILFKPQLNSEKRKLFYFILFYENHCLIIAFSTHNRDIQPFLKLGLTCMRISFALYSLVLRFALAKIACVQNVGSFFSQLFISSKIPTWGLMHGSFQFLGELQAILLLYINN